MLIWAVENFPISQAVILTLMLVAGGDGVDDDENNSDNEPDSDDQQTSGKTRHGRRLGKYKYKEEVIKRVEFNHPCRWAKNIKQQITKYLRIEKC